MRSFFLFAAIILLLGGAVTIFQPRAEGIPHKSERQAVKRDSVELISKETSLDYGFMATVLGGGFLAAAVTWKRWNR